jgi:hypothetical protein
MSVSEVAQEVHETYETQAQGRTPAPAQAPVPTAGPPVPALPERAIPAQKPSAQSPSELSPPAAGTRVHTGGRLPQRRSRRGEYAPAVEAAPTAVTPPGSPDEAGDWMEQFFEGGRTARPSATTPDSSEGQT